MSLRRFAVLALATVAFAAPADALAHGNASAQVARAAIKGEHKVLVILVTWGPQTFPREEVHRVVFDETNRWIQRSSYGLTSLAGDTTPWLTAFTREPVCEFGAIAEAAGAAARRAGYDPNAYARRIYVLPMRISCRFTGYALGDEVLLNGAVFRSLVAHELGHTYGLGFHANSWECGGGACRSIEYGDPFDTMGSGRGDFNAYEKYVIGWLNDGDVVRAQANGEYRIAELEQPAVAPQALVVTTARHEYWLDHRGEQPEAPRFADIPIATGLLVHAGPNPQAPLGTSVYPQAGILLSNPGGIGRPAILPGEAWGESGAFRAAVVGKVGSELTVRFEWTDAVAPSPPRVVAPARTIRARRPRTLEIQWAASAETGSGVVRYEVRLDRGAPRTYTLPAVAFGGYDRIRMPAPGAHTLTVVAIDRAGNRSAPATRNFTVRR